MKEISEKQALHKLAAYCSKAERCEFDVRKKLTQWSFSDEEGIDRIIKRLISENFINEERYSKAFVKDKIQYNKWGVNKIIYGLRNKGISDENIKLYLRDFSEDLYEEQLVKALNSRIKSVKYKDDYEHKNKLIRFALSKGYSYELVKKCISKILRSLNE